MVRHSLFEGTRGGGEEASVRNGRQDRGGTRLIPSKATPATQPLFPKLSGPASRAHLAYVSGGGSEGGLAPVRSRRVKGAVAPVTHL
jgi:hypothetical protein